MKKYALHITIFLNLCAISITAYNVYIYYKMQQIAKALETTEKIESTIEDAHLYVQKITARTLSDSIWFSALNHAKKIENQKFDALTEKEMLKGVVWQFYMNHGKIYTPTADSLIRAALIGDIEKYKFYTSKIQQEGRIIKNIEIKE